MESTEFPESFWVELTSSESGETSKFEFDKSQDPLANKPVGTWINDVKAENAFQLHQNTDWDKVRLSAIDD